MALIPVTANSATPAAPSDPCCSESSSVWSWPRDRISQSIGPGVQVPGPGRHRPRLHGEEHVVAALLDAQLDEQRLLVAGQHAQALERIGGV